jgi:hypothetical protein
MSLSPKALAVRKRLKDDFPFYAKAAMKIRTKEGEIKPLVLNAAQQILQKAIDEEMATRGFVRIIILKARQQGLSTCVGGHLYFSVSQNRARKAMVVTHNADSTRALFDMTKRFHENCPDALRPTTKYSSRRELSFDGLDSSYVVATAGGDSIARGETISHLHASELAFWPVGAAKDNWNGLIQAVPETKGTAVFVESTANGITGLFYDLWKGAVDGRNGYRPVFIPWFLDTSYRAPCPEPLDHTPEEESLIAEFDLDDEQLTFRRKRIAQTSSDLFKQEYPAKPDEAFLSTGAPVFNPTQLVELLDNVKDPVARLQLEGSEWENHPRGELTQFYLHVPGETYYIGADVAMGGGRGDYSVAQVLDSKKRQVAVWRSNYYNPDYFATILEKLGRFYNEALIIPENNSHGILTCTRLGKDFAYPNVYMVTEVDKLTERESVQIGFRTTVKTKPLIIDQLRAAIRDGELELNDKATIREMLSFIVTESGAMEAEQGCHDDLVMALAMVNHVHEGRFTPIEVTDEYYTEAI